MNDYDAETTEELERYLLDGGVPQQLVDGELRKLESIGVISPSQLPYLRAQHIEKLKLIPSAQQCISVSIENASKPFSCVPLTSVIRIVAGESVELKLPEVLGGKLPYSYSWTKNHVLNLRVNSNSYVKDVAKYDDSGWYTIEVWDADFTADKSYKQEIYVEVVSPTRTDDAKLMLWDRVAIWLGKQKLPFAIDRKTMIVTFTGLNVLALMPLSFPEGCVYLWEERSHGIYLSDCDTIASVVKQRWWYHRGEYQELDAELMKTVHEHNQIQYTPDQYDTDILKKIKLPLCLLIADSALPAERCLAS
eukprot:TRINITY_DN5414_c0_g1_i1.p1 TRINITY_DN5414_c0_g1~~TRINITY_DN5414_c0_g1_i1.p1  ORF type:complete len:306 (+),score=17.73 TRINITY_DN5414_c0_g1_i1:30-947(+)